MLRQRHWTVYDLADLPDDGLRYEALDGQLVVTPPPVARHQEVVIRLLVQLRAQATQQWRVLHEQAVRLDTDWRVPDVVVVPASLPLEGFLYQPDEVALAVEVVSASSRRTDRMVKPAEYAAAGVARYWRVETHPRVEVHAYELRGAIYAPSAPTAPFPVILDVGALQP